MKNPLLPFLLLLVCLSSCKQEQEFAVSEAKGEQIPILGEIPPDETLQEFIEPYKQNIDQEMNMVLAYTPFNLSKTNGELNSAIGNMMADAVMELSNPVFQKRTGNNIDVVLLNYGGIRSVITKGDITTRTAFQIMPFENEVVVAALTGEQVLEMVRYLIDDGAAHPLAGMELILNENNALKSVLIQGEPIQPEQIYYVATNDYLYQGGDNMSFFEGSEATELDYKIRNLLIDYFRTQDTIAPVRDKRFSRE